MKRIIILLLASFLASGVLTGKEEGRQRSNTPRPVYKSSGIPVQSVLNINNATMWVRADGFFDWVIEGSWNGTFPKGTLGTIFSEGIVWGGFVNDGQSPALRVGGSTYSTGLVAGAILTDANGRVTGREDPAASDVRIFRVRPDVAPGNETADLRDDAANFFLVPLAQVNDGQISELRQQYWTDWEEWPAQKGAPYQDVDSNGVYDPTIDIPGIPGADQTIWYVANDLGPNARVYGAPSIGLEMQMTLWAYSSELFNSVIFKRVRLIYKGTPTTQTNANISDMFITQWSDPDLGSSGDDFAGCDTTLGLGYVYQSSPTDPSYLERFGLPPPASGYDFMQGVIVPGAPTDTAIFNFQRIPGRRNLPMTTFSFFAAGSARSDPDLGSYSGTLQWYNLMRGCEPRPEHPSCAPFLNHLNQPTRFELSGDPVTGTGDIDGRRFSPGDRRLLLATGPFTMNRGDTQEVVVASVYGLGGNNLSSISVMKNNDQFAQLAYDKLFQELPGAPPPPRVNVTELNNEVILNWGADPASVNAIERTNRQGWEFEGYTVYQMPSASARFPQDAVRLGTFDLVNGIRTITNRVFDPTAGIVLEQVRQIGTDAGVQRYLRITRDAIAGRPLVNGQTYYFIVTAYSFNPDTTQDFRVLESRPQVLAVTPQSPRPGMHPSLAAGDTITVTHAGPSDGRVLPIVIDPNQLTGNTYRVTFADSADVPVWNLIDVTRDSVLLSNQHNQTGNQDYLIVDGMLVKVTGAPNDAKDFQEVANSAGPHDPTYGAFAFNSSGFPNPPGNPNDPPGERPTPNPEGASWGIHTGNATGDDAFDFHYATFVARTFRNDNFDRFVPFDFEIRFTPTGGLALKAFQPPGTVRINVPFELWNIGVNTPDDPSDDFRMIPLVFDGNESNAFDLDGVDHTISGGDNDPETDWFYWYEPVNKAPGSAGYNAWASGGSDDLIGDEVMARMVLVNFNGGSVNAPNFPANVNQQMPPAGTIFRIISTKPNTPADTFSFSAPSPTAFDPARARQDVDRINVYPNPYYGLNTQEADRLQKFVTFNHLPTRATIRIFNLAGVQVRVLQKDDQSQFIRWNLRNDNNLPVASGIYIVYIDMPDPLGVQKILKLAVIQEEQVLRTY
jgi:hypothetical protein